jgi:hypothetical protein
MARIAVEGLEEDIVPIMCDILNIGKHNVCYRNETPYEKADVVSIGGMLHSNPDLFLVCNAMGYFKFLEHYKKSTNVPVLVLTGGGPDLLEEVKRYTPHVLSVPLTDINQLNDKINSILNE